MRLIRVIYEPEKVFAEIKEMAKGGWLLPMIGCVLISLVTMAVVMNLIGSDTFARMQIEQSPRAAQMPPEQMATAMNITKIMTYVMVVIAPPVAILIIAGVLFGMVQMTTGGAHYSKVVSTTAYSQFAYGLIAGLISMAVVWMAADRTALDVQGLLKTNPTIFLDKTTSSKALYSLAGSLDLLSFWLIFLLALGLSKVTPKLTLGKALMLVIIPWAVWVIGKAGVSAIF